MTDHDCFIVDEPLPEALNFELLKNIGIKQLQASVGKVWTNYNESDPGVTILDQLCYGLTELGYCAQFPIEDVLTQENGKINIRGQFFEPQNVLTCSPVTPDDYRKLVHDNVPEVRVIYIAAESVPASACSVDQTGYTGRYHSYLSVKDSVFSVDIKHVIKRVHVLLNQHRNLAELFLLPVLLEPLIIKLAGRVWLTQSADAAKVQSQILQALMNYVAPQVVQSGYKELLSKGLELDQIFNGPKLRNGWIAGSDALGSKCQSVSLASLTTLLANIDGVLYVESLSFCRSDSETEISIDKNEIPNIVLSEQFLLVRNGSSVITQSNQSGQKNIGALKANHQAASVAAKVDLYPDFTHGRYRNIEEYYSIQNTFPDVYGIGHNSLESDAASYRVANSRQLKGYLMVFDQLLANQFSQLAHIGDLFSFQSPHAESAQALTAASAIPHNKFATTYHCQPLYDIPNVKPLLRGNEAFHYQFDSSIPDKQVEDEAWKKYKNFQFNEYIYGLRQCMESESEATTRRDAMLSHLMARHGDEASLYHDMIETCQRFGSELKTRIIVKSIWLQNFQMLSYHRMRAFDFYANNVLPLPGDPSIVTTIMKKYRQHHEAYPDQPNAAPDKNPLKQDWWHGFRYPTIDGEVDQAWIYSEAKLKKSDFEKYSTFELKVGILLGLPAHWRSLAGKLFALIADPSFNKWLSQAVKDARPYYLTDSDVSIVRVNGKDQLFEGKQCLMDIVWSSDVTLPTSTDYQNHADQLLWLATQRRGFLLIEPILLLSTQNPNAKKVQETRFLSASLLFPAYVTLIQQLKFQNFIDTLVELHWPAHVEKVYLAKSFVVMKTIIHHFVMWNNEQKNSSKRDSFF